MTTIDPIYGSLIYLPVLIDDDGAPLTDDHGRPISHLPGETGQTLVTADGGFLTQRPAYEPDLYDARTATFFVAEIEAYRPQLKVTETLRVSDIGYRTRPNDPSGVVVYPGLLDTAFEIDRRISLELTGAGTSSYGAIRITNLGSRYDLFTLARNSDSRPVSIKIGQKFYDHARGLHVDPAYTTLRPVFTGAASSWLLSEEVLEIPLKDLTYLLDKPIQTKTYAGTGGTEGGPELKGQAKPMTRGGTTLNPVRNVPLKLIDTVNNIWQWTDGLGTVAALYENSAPVFSYSGDVVSLYNGETPPGGYRTCNAKGLLQLGSPSVGVITADVTGACGGVFVPTAVSLARAVMINDLGVSAVSLNAASFSYADIAYPYQAGYFIESAQGTVTTGLQVLTQLLLSVGGRLLSSRKGQIGVFVPPRTQLGAPPSVRLDTTNVVSVTAIALPASLDPPPYHWQVSYMFNYNAQASGFNPSISERRKQFVSEVSRYAEWYSEEVKANWTKPGDPAPVNTNLLRQIDAQYLADTLGDQWRARPDYFQVVVPIDFAVSLDIGSYVYIVWPLGLLADGIVGQIVGEQIRSGDNFVTFEVLINTASLSADPIEGMFTLDFSLLDVGTLGETEGSTFYLDVSLLDMDIFGVDLEVVVPPNNARNPLEIGPAIDLTNGKSTGTPEFISRDDPAYVFYGGYGDTSQFTLDSSLLDVSYFAPDDGGVGTTILTPPTTGGDALTPTSPTPIETSPIPVSPNQTDLSFVMDQSMLDVGVLTT